MNEKFGFGMSSQKEPEMTELEKTLGARFVHPQDEPHPQHINKPVFVDARGNIYAGIYRGLIKNRSELVLFPSLISEYRPDWHDYDVGDRECYKYSLQSERPLTIPLGLEPVLNPTTKASLRRRVRRSKEIQRRVKETMKKYLEKQVANSQSN